MKKGIIILIIILSGGGWLAKKFVDRANKDSGELELFQDHASNYGDSAEIFITTEAEKHHDEAFEKSYRMWKLSPMSELDLSSHFDEKTYYLTLGKIINEKAKAEGQNDARLALIDMGRYYGVPPKTKDADQEKSTLQNKPSGKDASAPSPLGDAKLGDKRKVPGGHRRDDR